MIRRTILVAASISFVGAMLTSLMAHADSAAPEVSSPISQARSAGGE